MKKSISKNHSSAFKFAWLVISFFGGCFSKALKTGWILAKLRNGQKVTIYFDKVNKKTGEVTPRRAIAVILGSTKTIEDGYVKFVEQLPNGKTQYRSFRFERLIFDKEKQNNIDKIYNQETKVISLQAVKVAA